jgi:mannose-6-phosphate isomerase-like protein (cupin superfamily)
LTVSQCRASGEDHLQEFVTRALSAQPDAIAPDGSEVRLLATASRGSMAHFKLPQGGISKAVAHKTVEEVWYFIKGSGRMWRKLAGREELTQVSPGTSIAIPVGAHFQFRNDGSDALEAIGVTMPPWPGMDEAFAVQGIWPATG